MKKISIATLLLGTLALTVLAGCKQGESAPAEGSTTATAGDSGATGTSTPATSPGAPGGAGQ